LPRRRRQSVLHLRPPSAPHPSLDPIHHHLRRRTHRERDRRPRPLLAHLHLRHRRQPHRRNPPRHPWRRRHRPHLHICHPWQWEPTDHGRSCRAHREPQRQLRLRRRRQHHRHHHHHRRRHH